MYTHAVGIERWAAERKRGRVGVKKREGESEGVKKSEGEGDMEGSRVAMSE
jgi:hypothetical protein